MSILQLALIAVPDPSQTHHWLFPETAEIIYGGISSILVFAGLYKFGWPVAKKGLAARTERIQKELDNAKSTLGGAEAEAASIRKAIGDIASERDRLLAEADTQAAALLYEGRQRVTVEVSELEVRGDADIAASRSRSSDELRASIAQLASGASQLAVVASLNAATQQELIEDFINSVGASR